MAEADRILIADGGIAGLCLAAALDRHGFTAEFVERSVIPARPAGVTHLMLLTGDGCFFGLVPVGEGGTYGFAGVDGDRFADPLDAP